MDTFSSVVSVNLHLQNGVTGSVFVNKKADRDVASIGTQSARARTASRSTGLPTKYDFFLFSRDHYYTLDNAWFELIDQGYAMCLDRRRHRARATRSRSTFIDTDGNYNELYTYVLYSPNGGVLETNTLHAARSRSARPPIPPRRPQSARRPTTSTRRISSRRSTSCRTWSTPCSARQSPGQPPAYHSDSGGGAERRSQAGARSSGRPGFNGYSLNVVGASKQPVLISQIYSANLAYPIAGSTTILPINPKTGKVVPFYGSLSHGLDKQVPLALLQSADGSYMPRTTMPHGPTAGLFGGNGQGALIGTPFSCAFQGSGAIPPAIAGDPTPGTTMKARRHRLLHLQRRDQRRHGLDRQVGHRRPAGSTSSIRPIRTNPIYVVVTTPKFTLNGNTLRREPQHHAARRRHLALHADGRRQELSVRARQHPGHGRPDALHLQPDAGRRLHRDATPRWTRPRTNEAPSPIALTPFTDRGCRRRSVTTVDVFNTPGALNGIVARRHRPPVQLRSRPRHSHRHRRARPRPPCRSRPG